MKYLKALAVLALAVTLAVPAYAETQNVKVSGSIDAYWFLRSDYDLRGGNDAGQHVVGGTSAGAGGGAAADLDHRSDGDDFFRTNTQIEIAADLTDNVSTVINVVNQRDWNADQPDGNTTAIPNNQAAEFDIDLDLAYVQMKEIFYSPLTLTIGRQDLWFGRGFIVGNNNRAWDANGTVSANEYSVTTAFDAARATLDFNPWTIDLVYAKVTENATDPEDDLDLYIANINYKFAEYNAVAEAYFVAEIDRATLSTHTTAGVSSNDTEVIGGRVQFDPISQITLGGELAYQFGNYRALATDLERDRSAWAFDVFGTYRWDYNWKPEVTVEYVHFSGEDDLGANSTEYNAWNGLYRGKFYTAYADFREFVYQTLDTTGTGGTQIDQPATQNQNLIQIKGSIKPLEDLLLEASFTYLWLDEDVHLTAGNQSTATADDEIGWEVDLQATYDYTEDVSFGFLAAWFVPGDFYAGPGDDTATDLVSSVKVVF